ncbi:MAG: pstC [Solirubrobacteraceae bacterium]|nr:pstC [Solirubrobacteraceae bacterium]
MSIAVRTRRPVRAQGSAADRLGDALLKGLCILACLVALALMADLVYQVISRSHLAFSKFGIGFLTDTTWKPNFDQFGAGSLIFGTAVTSAMALAIAVPIGISIGLYLSLLAPRRLRGIIGPLVELLAAIPSVILGFWGIIVLAPVIRDAEPWLHRTLGFIPLFGAPQTAGASVFIAGVILAIMVVPIVASISRDLFLTVPRDLQDGATALGATQWEVVRGVILPSTLSGVASASLLGLGRALGEAIAVAQVIGAGNLIHTSLFETGDTMASRIALQFPGALSKLHFASLFYLAVVLLAMGLVSNLIAQWISWRFGPERKFSR